MIGRCQGVSVCASVTNRSQRGPERLESWLRGRDLNPRPLGYEPNELPDCSTPRHWTEHTVYHRRPQRIHPRPSLIINLDQQRR
jgi:hypothetical protein